MRRRVIRVSPHQNAKVVSVLLAVAIIPFLLIMALVMSVTGPQLDQQGNPVEFPYVILLILPLFYLLFGYASIAFLCWVYNLLVRYVGGLEFDDEQGVV